MEYKELFSERQKFTQWWLWVILIGINGHFLMGLLKNNHLVRGLNISKV